MNNYILAEAVAVELEAAVTLKSIASESLVKITQKSQLSEAAEQTRTEADVRNASGAGVEALSLQNSTLKKQGLFSRLSVWLASISFPLLIPHSLLPICQLMP